MVAVIQSPPLPENPYPGIESFRYIDQQIFSAREDETWNLLSTVLIYRGVLLYGDSGSGKSSLVNAGLIPEALKENLIVNRLRIQHQRGREITIERIPVENADASPYLPSVLIDPDSDDDKLLTVDMSLDDFYERVKDTVNISPEQPHPLFVFDQFEEFSTLFEEMLRGRDTAEARAAQKEAPEVRQAIIDTLTSVIEDDSLPVKLLFVFREDYLAKLNPLIEACPELLDQYVRLLPPRSEEAEGIIRAPFVKDNVRKKFVKRLPGLGGREISETLAKEVAHQLDLRSDNGFIDLSELQVVCRKLWESADPANYFEQREGNIQKVIEDYWAGVLRKLGRLYRPAIALLGHMVTSAGTRNIVSEDDLNNLENSNFSARRIESALKSLVQSRLVRREPRHKIYFYEITSEFLVPWIQLEKKARLAELKAQEYSIQSRQKLKESEKQQRRLTIGAAVLLGLLIVFGLLSAYAFSSRQEAANALAEAQKTQAALRSQKDWSGNIITLLNKLTSNEEKSRLAAVEGLISMDTSGQLPRELVPVVLAVMSREESEEVSKKASYFFALAARQANTELTVSILKGAESNTTLADAGDVAPRVYIQLASDRQRPRADKVAAELIKNGFTVPGFELVDSRRATRSNQLRYYKAADETTPIDPNVAKILQIIKSTDSAKWSDPVGLRSSSKVRAGHFEIWFARDPTQSDGTLYLNFEDEFGDPIDPPSFRVSLISPRKTPLRARNSAQIPAPPGTYTLVVLVPGYETYQTSIDIEAGADSTATVYLRRKTK